MHDVQGSIELGARDYGTYSTFNGRPTAVLVIFQSPGANLMDLTAEMTRVLDRLFGPWLFRPFNRFFNASSERYQGGVGRSLRHRGMVFLIYALLLAGTGLMFKVVPPGFIPTQDKMYLIGGVQLPAGELAHPGVRRPERPLPRARGRHHRSRHPRPAAGRDEQPAPGVVVGPDHRLDALRPLDLQAVALLVARQVVDDVVAGRVAAGRVVPRRHHPPGEGRVAGRGEQPEPLPGAGPRAARPVRRVEDDDVTSRHQPGALEVEAGGQPGLPAADHDDVHQVRFHAVQRTPRRRTADPPAGR